MAFVSIITLAGRQRVRAHAIQGLWAVNRVQTTEGPRKDAYQVTHIASGFGFLDPNGTDLDRALALLRVLATSRFDWSLPNGSESVTKELSCEGRRLRAAVDDGSILKMAVALKRVK